jgi:hypothetical protein
MNSFEELEMYITHLKQAAELGHMDAIKRTIHELEWTVQKLKENPESNYTTLIMEVGA